MSIDTLPSDDSASLTACECVFAGSGFCNRHGIKKTKHLQKLCRERSEFWEAWEQGKGPGQSTSESEQGQVVTNYKQDTAKLWAEAHQYAPANESNWSIVVAKSWYENWCKRIPRYGCGCSDHWRAITREMPPDFSTPKSLFEWFWAMHNQVSRERAGKPEMSLEDCYLQWWPKKCESEY